MENHPSYNPFYYSFSNGMHVMSSNIWSDAVFDCPFNSVAVQLYFDSWGRWLTNHIKDGLIAIKLTVQPEGSKPSTFV